MIKHFIDLLKELYLIYQRYLQVIRRKKKINKLVLKLYRLDGIMRVRVGSLSALQKYDLENGIDCRYIIAIDESLR